MRAREKGDEADDAEHVVGNGFDEPTAAFVGETSTRPAAVRANARVKAGQWPTSGALPVRSTQQARRLRSFFSRSKSRMLASQAWAIIESVMCRYQLCQKRTSYSFISAPLTLSAHVLPEMHCDALEKRDTFLREAREGCVI
jgi:hypothetical protein